MPGHPLDPLLRPRSVVLVGASAQPGSVGQLLLANLVDGGFGGPIFAVNPCKIEVDRATWLARVEDLLEPAELAIVATPAPTVPSIISALGRSGTKVAVVVSGGLTEKSGLRAAMLEAARPHGLRIVGPNCLGILAPHAGLNAAFARSRARPGGLALISQSGALVTAMLDWAAARDLGFSGLVSCGEMADIDAADLIELFADDPDTSAIALYLEGVADGTRLVAAARAASRRKPVVAIKAGRSPAALGAVRSHSGALMGNAAIYAAAFRRAGIVQTDTLLGLFDAAETLCVAPPAPGPRLAIISNGGGAGILAVDAMAAGGARLAELSEATVATLDKLLPPLWSRGNPVDLVGDARPERFAAALAAVLADANVDAILCLHCPTALADGAATAEAVARTWRECGSAKPVLACWLGDANARAAAPALTRAGIPNYESPEEAVQGFEYLLASRLPPTDAPSPRRTPAGAPDKAGRILESCVADGREWLDEIESKKLLDVYGIRTAPTRFGRTAEEIRAAAGDIPPPYAVKIVSPDILHKSDVGGVRLGLASADAAAQAAHDMAAALTRSLPRARIGGFAVETMIAPGHAHELIIGGRRDPAFGPVLVAGAGGKAVELLGDTALELAPVDTGAAAAMIARTRISRLLAGYRDEPAADLEAITAAISAVSDLMLDLPEIAELDINPLVASPGGICALDARIRVAAAPAGSC